MPKSIANLQLIQETSVYLANARRDARVHADTLRPLINVQYLPVYAAAVTRATGSSLVTNVLDKIAANNTAIQTACTEWDVDYAALLASYNAVRQAAVAMRDTSTDGSGVIAVLDAIISGLPKGTRLD
jgi:hypothetical protein